MITANTTRNDIASHLDASDVSYTEVPRNTAAGPAYDETRGAIRVQDARLIIYWDASDPSCQGWAWRQRFDDGDCSGGLDSFEELDELVAQAA